MREASRRFDDRLKCFWWLLSASIAILFAVIAQAQQTSTPQSESAKTDLHRIHAVRITESIKIDGVLDEAVWATAEAATDFRQESPTEGAPASERTEVRVLYDSKNLYLGIRALDSDGSKIN